MTRRAALLAAVWGVPALVVAGVGAWSYAKVWLPICDQVADLGSYRPPATILVLDRHGNLLDEIGPDHRWVGLDELPPVVVDAFVAAEDRRFWTHHGVDARGILRAAWVDWHAGQVEEGGSTITQQLVKQLVVGDASTVERKAHEMVAAWALERTLPKERILELYLNVVYLGSSAYGIEAASRAYFGVGASELRADQAATLATLVPAPSVRAPRKDPAAAIRRRDAVLRAMGDAGSLTPEEVERASILPLGLFVETGPRATSDAYRTEVRRLVERALGPDPPSELGLVVHTGADPSAQLQAEAAVRDAIEEVDARRRRRQRSPPRRIGEVPGVEGAAVVLENRTGEIVALVGGYDDELGGLVRATRSRRQPGSAFKPVIYAAALAAGAHPGDIVMDEPVTFPGADGSVWTPGNHLDRYRGPITLREALVVSSNSVAVTLADELGIDAVIVMAESLGVRTPLRRDLSLALGGSEVTPLELAAVYQTVAREGTPTEPVLVTQITDATGAVLARAGERGWIGGVPVDLPGGEREEALDPEVARSLGRMLRSVVDHGTALDARDPRQERAGKTGTTNDYTDAWFVGFTRRHTIAVWIGDDDHEPLGTGETGSRVALPAFAAIALALGTPGTLAEPERLFAPTEAAPPATVTLGSVHVP